MKRRAALWAIGLIAGYFGVRSALRLLPSSFEFEPLDQPEGFRRITSGAISAGLDPFVGLERPDQSQPATPTNRLLTRLCSTLFSNRKSPNSVQIASFTDYNCPYCRVLNPILTSLDRNTSARVNVTWHEYPLLSDSSLVAARAALAAEKQGGYVEFNRRLMRARVVPNDVYIQRLAESVGLDAIQLKADQTSPHVEKRLSDAFGLANLFEIPGTPALVVGRTLVVGQISEARLLDLIELERELGPPPCG